MQLLLLGRYETQVLILLINIADYDVFPTRCLHFLRQFKFVSVPLDTSDTRSDSQPKSVGYTRNCRNVLRYHCHRALHMAVIIRLVQTH